MWPPDSHRNYGPPLLTSLTMEWMRTLLLGTHGKPGLLKHPDLVAAEKAINQQGVFQWRDRMNQLDRDQRVAELEGELARQRLAIQALTRFLITKGIVQQAELDAFIQAVDAEDGVVDGKLAIKSKKRRLQPDRKVQGKVFQKLADPPQLKRRSKDEVKPISVRKRDAGKKP